ncbi:hypothetical protein [Nocardia sp. NBC_00403]|uniref:hypothetical protein n=1 Tax=Nocardia sp. NBC_00403 TaxID=2975990 RepID=UPI002E1D49D9
MSTDFVFCAGEVPAAGIEPGNFHDVASPPFSVVKGNVPMDYVSITSDNVHRRNRGTAAVRRGLRTDPSPSMAASLPMHRAPADSSSRRLITDT